MGIQTDTVLDAAMLPTGGTAGQVLEKTNGADYAVGWAAGGGGGGFIPTLFQAFMTTVTANSAAFSTLAGWDAADLLTQGDYSWNAATGVLTINTAGTYSVSAHVLGDVSGNNRVELWMRLLLNGSAYQKGGLDVADKQYAMRNSSQNEGSAQLSNVLMALSANDTIALQTGYAGAGNDITMARMTVTKMA